MISVEQIRQMFPRREVRFFESVDSSNTLALEWLQQGAADGSVIIADEQRKGRGRMGRIWYTPPGVALAVSLILRPTEKALPQMVMLGAVAVAEMLESMGIDQVGIKWPNDVQIAGKKVSGILPEAVWNGNQLQGAVLGIGVNVRVQFSDALVAAQATNIETRLGRQIERTVLLIDLLQRLDHWTGSLGTPHLMNAWKQRLTTIGQQVSIVIDQQQKIQGRAEDVDESGAILVRTDKGDLRPVLMGDVESG